MSYSFPDYYAVLGVASSVSAEELKRAYRRQARLLHPDRNPNDVSLEDGFKRLSQAYQVLSTPELRTKYDRSFQEHMQNQNSARVNDGQKPLGSFFRKLFGTQQSPTIHGQDLRYHLTLKLPELFESSLMLIELPSSRACSRCDGKGRYADEICRGCLGAGREPFVNRLEVKIPPGVDNGTKIKVRGEGERGIMGGKDGDLYIEIHVEPHPLLKRKGANLLCEVPIPLSVAVCGGDVDVPYAKKGVRLRDPCWYTNEPDVSTQRQRLTGEQVIRGR